MLAALVAIAVFAAAARAQTRDPILNMAIRQAAGIPTVGDQLASAVHSYGSLVGELAERSAEIEAARRAYWAAVAAGDAPPEVEDRLARVLMEKDFYYLATAFLPEGIYSHEMSPGAAVNMLAGEMDDGIHAEAQHAYGEWVEAIREFLGAEPGEMVSILEVTRLEPALRATAAEYGAYAWRRDLVEFRNAGVTPPGFSNAEWFIFTRLLNDQMFSAAQYVGELRRAESYALAKTRHALMLAPEDPVTLAADELDLAQSVFGSERVAAQAERLVALPMEAFATVEEPVRCPAELGGWEDTYLVDIFFNGFASEEAKDYFLTTARLDAAVEGSSVMGLIESAAEPPLAAAVTSWSRLVATHGEVAVREACDRVRQAHKRAEQFMGIRWYPRLDTDDLRAIGVAPEPRYRRPSLCVEAILLGQTLARYERREAGGEDWTAEELEPLASRGLTWAMVALADKDVTFEGPRVYFSGDDKCLAWLRAASDLDDQPDLDSRTSKAVARACYLLGELTAQGVLPGGAAEAVAMLERAVRLENPDAAASLAMLLLLGKGVPEGDPRRAPEHTFNLARTASRGGSMLGEYLYAVHVEGGLGTKADPKAARQMFISAADAGNPMAQQWCSKHGIDWKAELAHTPPMRRRR